MRKVICVAVIKNKHILLVKKRNAWILPGGKLEGFESEEQCLVRELKQELPNVKLQEITFYADNFFGITPHSQVKRHIVVYLGKILGKAYPSAEICDTDWTNIPEEYNLSEASRKIICSLRQTGHL